MTASRRVEARLDVPASISAIDADELRLLGATHAAEALNRIAGVMIQRGSGQESLTAIRSPVLTGPGACGTFLLLEDGMPLRPVGSPATSTSCSNEHRPGAGDRGDPRSGHRAVWRERGARDRQRDQSDDRGPRHRERLGARRRCDTTSARVQASRERRRRAGSAPGAASRTTAASAPTSPVDDAKLNLLHQRAWRGGDLRPASRRHRAEPGNRRASSAGSMPIATPAGAQQSEPGGVPRRLEHARLGELEPRPAATAARPTCA